MSMRWVREQYGVPAKRGGRVTFDGDPGTIVGTTGPHLRVRLDTGSLTVIAHPTWRMQYDDDPGATMGQPTREDTRP